MTSIESSECLVANRVCVEVPCILILMQIWEYMIGNNWKYVRNIEYVNMITNIGITRDKYNSFLFQFLVKVLLEGYDFSKSF